MNGLFVVGMSHKTAPLEVRERFVVPGEELPAVLLELKARGHLAGVFATSTCNRFEVYGTTHDERGALLEVRSWLAERARAEQLPEVEPYLYEHSGAPAVRHLFRVTASLDSMVVGEAQILGQVKSAYAEARRVGTVDPVLKRCMTRALRVARTVRRETEIARHPVSVPQVSIELASKVFGNLAGRTVLIVGAGKMSEMAAKHLATHGVGKTLVANRSPERALELARRLDAEPHPLDAVPELLIDADIVIASTGSRDFVIKPDTVKQAMPKRRYRPLFLIDIAVPRDIDPRVGQISNVYLFDIDDLQAVVESNLGARHREAREGERIVREQADEFTRELEVDRVAPTIVALRQKLLAIKDEETARALHRLDGLGEKERERVGRLASTLINRILHEPTMALKRLAREGGADEAVDLVRVLFGLRLEELEGAEDELAEGADGEVLAPAGPPRDGETTR
jgi:glutamyl-tRNA reductase